jgi:transcriptional regulator with XRE-family HTH domain
MATIVEVAEGAGVSIATVSNVIRGTRRVSPKLTELVRTAIHELNYSPNEIARSLKARQTRMLAMVLPDITNPFFPEIIRGAEDTAFERGYFLMTANTDEQIGRKRRIVGALRSYRVDGILLASASGTDISHLRRTLDAGVALSALIAPSIANARFEQDRIWKCAKPCYRQLRIEITDNLTLREIRRTCCYHTEKKSRPSEASSNLGSELAHPWRTSCLACRAATLRRLGLHNGCLWQRTRNSVLTTSSQCSGLAV